MRKKKETLGSATKTVDKDGKTTTDFSTPMTPADRKQIAELIKSGKSVREVAGATGFPMDWVAIVVGVSDLPQHLIDKATANFYPKPQARR